jgi:hypothetical protein
VDGIFPNTGGLGPYPNSIEITGFIVGHTYRWIGGNADLLATQSTASTDDIYITGPTFQATQTSYYLQSTDEAMDGTRCTDIIVRVGRTLAYARFNNPADADIGVLLTDDWRDGSGEDGGRGRAFRIQANNVPLEIPLNGYDLWDTCRLTQCNNALVMHRHGEVRHYFPANSVNTTTDRITLNCTPQFTSGDLVEYNAVQDSDAGIVSSIEGPAAPASGASYYVKIVSGATIELYTQFTAPATFNGQLLFDTAVGRFYLRRVATNPGFFGNDAPNLILQPTATLNAFDNGWRAVPANVEITNTDDVLDNLTAPNHRLQPGQGVELISGTISGWSGTKYARPLNDHTLELYDTADHALDSNSTTGRTNLTTAGQTGYLAKLGASKLPMPPLRESVYYLGRLIGINQKDNILISDAFDFLHFTLFTGTIPANLGESGQANWLRVLGEDVLLIGRSQSVLALTGHRAAGSWWRSRANTAASLRWRR